MYKNHLILTVCALISIAGCVTFKPKPTGKHSVVYSADNLHGKWRTEWKDDKKKSAFWIAESIEQQSTIIFKKNHSFEEVGTILHKVDQDVVQVSVTTKGAWKTENEGRDLVLTVRSVKLVGGDDFSKRFIRIYPPYSSREAPINNTPLEITSELKYFNQDFFKGKSNGQDEPTKYARLGKVSGTNAVNVTIGPKNKLDGKWNVSWSRSDVNYKGEIIFEANGDFREIGEIRHKDGGKTGVVSVHLEGHWITLGDNLIRLYKKAKFDPIDSFGKEISKVHNIYQSPSSLYQKVPSLLLEIIKYSTKNEFVTQLMKFER